MILAYIRKKYDLTYGMGYGAREEGGGGGDALCT